jgi:hypothetical protein
MTHLWIQSISYHICVYMIVLIVTSHANARHAHYSHVSMHSFGFLLLLIAVAFTFIYCDVSSSSPMRVLLLVSWVVPTLRNQLLAFCGTTIRASEIQIRVMLSPFS